jgi:hypothetical protein
MNDILTKAADLLEQPNAWCQGDIAKDAEGNRVPFATDPKACQWCLIGAICHVAKHAPDDEIAKVGAAISDDEYLTIAGWNDAPERTQTEVVAVLRKAAAKA